jgi:hypothetical protein
MREPGVKDAEYKRCPQSRKEQKVHDAAGFFSIIFGCMSSEP